MLLPGGYFGVDLGFGVDRGIWGVSSGLDKGPPKDASCGILERFWRGVLLNVVRSGVPLRALTALCMAPTAPFSVGPAPYPVEDSPRSALEEVGGRLVPAEG